jgi:hypothetical protein
MSRSKSLVVACFATFALCAVVSATAFAGGQWDINGTPLAAHATVGLTNILVLNDGQFKILATGETPEIVCKGHEVSLVKGVLIGPDGLLASSVAFRECSVRNSENCTLGSSIIETVPVHALAHLDGTLNALLLVLPETKATFATVKYDGNLCALESVATLTGGFHILVHEAIHSTKRKRALAFSLKGQLKDGSSEAELSGLVGDLELTSGLPWSFL